MQQLSKGLKFSKKFKVTEEHTAKHLGSGDVEVLSTPSLILFMEEACRAFTDEYLPEEQTTVGTMVNIRHMKAAPVGAEIEVRAEVLSIDGRRLTYWVEAWWGDKKIGQGVHERVIVNRKEFMEALVKELKK
ncbi:MAG: thioesterase family protein [Desulfurococcales archaeon]|nr:thioesterase family protein [Desulfurococcales archaeon]